MWINNDIKFVFGYLKIRPVTINQKLFNGMPNVKLFPGILLEEEIKLTD